MLIIQTLLFIGMVSSISSQTDSCSFVIRGAVYDQITQEPLVSATVQLNGFMRGTYTDDEGIFEIGHLCGKEYDIEVTYVGYKSITHHHDHHHPTPEFFLAPEENILKSIVVEAHHSESDLETVTTSKLEGRDLEAVQTESFGDAVSKIAGVNTIGTGQNISKPVIHGLHSNRILIINNGLRHEFQNWGVDHAPEIDPSAISEIEVVKGAATVRFGQDALGGVILTKPTSIELSQPLGGHLSTTGKSNGRSLEGGGELHKGFKRFGLLAGGSYVKQGDLHAPNYILSNSGKEEFNYYGGFRLHVLPELDIEGYYSHVDQKLGILQGSTFGNLEDLERAIGADEPLFTQDFTYDIAQPRQETKHDLYKAIAHYIGKKQSLEVQYGYQENKRKEFGLRKGDSPTIDLLLKTHSIDANWLHPDIGSLSGRLGMQWQKQANDNLPGTNTVPFIPNYDSKQFGIYLIESLDLHEHIFEVGIRYDAMQSDITGREPDNTIYRNTISFNNVTATLGYKRELNEETSFSTNFGTAWRPPNVAELYRFGQQSFFLEYGLWRYTIDDRFDFVSTTQGILTEEDRPVPAEIGYKWISTYEMDRSNFQFEATAYINYIENYIYSKPGGLTRTPRGVFVYFLVDQTDALFWGTDITSRWQHSPQFASTINGSFLWAKQSGESDFFVGQPPANLNYAIGYTPDWQFLDHNKFRLSLNYTLEQFQHPRIITVDEFLNAHQNDINRFVDDASDFDIVAPPSGYLLTNFTWEASWKKVRMSFQIKNILNVSYRNYTDRLRYFADGLGRNYALTLRYEF